MTRDELRAIFAGCALIRGIGVDCHDQVDPAHCFTVADAMLAEHERRQAKPCPGLLHVTGCGKFPSLEVPCNRSLPCDIHGPDGTGEGRGNA